MCILMFLIIAFRKSFRNIMLVIFFELFDQKKILKYNLIIFLGIFFLS
jgi:hypothetical protein